MGSLEEEYRSAAVAPAARALWATRGLPAADGVVGRGAAPLVRQFEGAYTAGDPPGLVALRAVVADADARYLALSGRRALGTLRRGTDGTDGTDDPIGPVLSELSVWTGGEGGMPFDSAERREGVAAILGRMATAGLVVTRDASLRVCSYCAAPRSPERIIYQEEEGDTFLVRFPVADGDRRVQALAWVDAPWRLLGVTALLLHPEMPYVVARYRRKGVDELVLTSRSSLGRLTTWLAGAEVEVVEEGPGARWAGRPYDYPLRSEFPMGADLTPPAGTLQTVPDVGDSGTGIVPLVPGHGGTDAQVAERLGITGWPLVTPRGQLATALLHKYAGLDLETASEFVLRDLGDGGALFARLRVRRGVPHCAICGTALVWAPGRAWCLEPSQLPPVWAEAYRRLLPREPPIGQIEIAAWPVSESVSRAAGVGTATLLECPQCDRLESPDGPSTCSCGATRRPVTRRLLPAILGTLEGWARSDPFPSGDLARIYLNERRRAPALVHHLAVISGVRGVPRDVEMTLLLGAPEGAIQPLVVRFGADAVRGALVRYSDSATTPSSVEESCAQEARFLEQYWHFAKGVLDRLDPALLTAFQPAVTGFLSELQPEDASILARWERARVATLAQFDGQHPGRAYRRLARFLSNDLPRYRSLVSPRLLAAAPTSDRRAALRTLHHILRSAAVLLSPVAPHTAELVYGAATTAGTSLSESAVEAVDANLLDDARARGWERWDGVLAAVERFRASQALSPGTPLPKVVAIVGTEDLAEALRADRPTLERLANVENFEACGPATPWTGRRRDLEPVLSEIQKVYPSEATQIAHLLRRTPSRRRAEGSAPEPLEVILQGTPRRVLPSMVAFTERLPERVVPAWWKLGELYVELPSDRPAPPRSPPPMSPDLFRLVRTIERERRRRAPPPGRPPEAVLVATVDPLADEVRRVAPALAVYLAVPEVKVIEAAEERSHAAAFQGRTRTGVRWWLYLPGLAPASLRVKHRMARGTGSRVRAPRPPTAPEEGVDFGAPDYIAREEQVRALMQELDGLLGAPLLGFAKTSAAWDAGLHSRADYEAVSFDTLAALPGFGWPLAESLVGKLGRTPPPRPRTARSFLPARRAPPPLAVRPLDSVIREAAVGGTPAAVPGEEPPPGSTGAAPLAPAPSDEPGAAVSSPTSGAPQEASDAEAELWVPPPPPPAELVTAEAAVTPLVAETTTAGSPEAPSPRETATQTGDAPAPVAQIDLGAALPGAPAPTGREELTRDAPAVSPSEMPISPGRPDPETPLFGAESEETERTETRGVRSPLESGPDAGDIVTTEIRASPTEEPSPRSFSPRPEPPLGESDGMLETSPDSPRVRHGEQTEGGTDASQVPTVPAAEPVDNPARGGAATTEGFPAVDPPAPGLPAPELPGAEFPPVPGSARDDTIPMEPGRALEEIDSEETASEGLVPPHEPPSPVPQGPLETPSEAEVAPAPPPATPAGAESPALETGATPMEPDVGEPALRLPSDLTPADPERSPQGAPEVLPEPPPTSGGVDLVVSTSYLPALAEFLEATAAGHRGLAVVRESPERLRSRIGHRPAEVYWLTNLGRGLTLKPSDLESYQNLLGAAVERDRVTAFFLEGLEYLVRVHGAERVLTVLLDLHARARAHDARVWACVHPDLIPRADLELLVRAFPPD